MRMRERSSVERMRIALTEKRDILGDMIMIEGGRRNERDRVMKRRE